MPAGKTIVIQKNALIDVLLILRTAFHMLRGRYSAATTFKMERYCHKALHLGRCSIPRSASDAVKIKEK